MKKLLLPLVLLASGWTGTVTQVVDGNAMSVLSHETSQVVMVRLWASDAPELEQSFGKEAKDFLENLVSDQEVTVEDVDNLSPRVKFVRLYIGDQYVNQEMVSHGFSWVDKALPDVTLLLQSLEQACSDGLGLWSDKRSIDPKAWRRQYRMGSNSLDPVSKVKSLDDISKTDPETRKLPIRSKSNHHVIGALKTQ